MTPTERGLHTDTRWVINTELRGIYTLGHQGTASGKEIEHANQSLSRRNRVTGVGARQKRLQREASTP